jgi:superfamily I DNA/RNA helicase
MRTSWWRKQTELDDKQKEVITLPRDGRYIITGPPGSGKTNLLLLRAMFLSSSGLKDVLFLTVGRTLQEFIVTGVGSKGLIATDQIMTLRKWTMKHLAEHSPQFMRNPPTGNYDEKQEKYAQELNRVNKRLSTIYSAILIDEVQDLTGAELRAVALLTKRIMVAGDDRQRIQGGGEGLDAAVTLGLKPIELEFHYRIGRRICEAADIVLPPPPGIKPLVQTCNYDEAALPSSRRLVPAESFDKQLDTAIQEIRIQLKAYPREAIGIFVPRKRQISKVQAILENSAIAGLCVYHDPDSKNPRQFPEDKQVFVMTIHSAKGTEFRAVHIVGAEELNGNVASRRVGFTAFTRAKTSLAVYYTGSVLPYVAGAFSTASTPKLDDLFS